MRFLFSFYRNIPVSPPLFSVIIYIYIYSVCRNGAELPPNFLSTNTTGKGLCSVRRVVLCCHQSDH